MPTTPQQEVVFQRCGGSTPDYGDLVLQYFDRTWDEVATVDDLSAYVQERGSSGRDETQIRVHLHHVTLPKLADGGLIDYDASEKGVCYRWDSPGGTAE